MSSRNRRVSVTCRDCGITWLKRSDSLSSWEGRCRSCAEKQKRACETPERRAANSARARAQLLLQGGIPNAVKFTSERMHETANHRWKGGKPRCIDCGRELSTYGHTRCVPCYHTSRTGVPRSANTMEKIRAYWNRRYCRTRRVSAQYCAWVRAVLRRDDFTCQDCGTRQVALHVHHLKPKSLFPELAYDIDNGQALCLACHSKTDSFGGKIHKLRRTDFGS